MTFLELFAIQFLGIQFSHTQKQNLKLSIKKFWRLEGDLTFLELFAIQFLGIQFSHIQKQNLKLFISVNSL